MTIKRKIIAIVSLLVAIIVMASIIFTNVLSVNASREYAALKGFNIEGFNYSTDKSVNNKVIKNGGTTLGNMSLWVGKYNLYAADNQTYTALFIEARICALHSKAKNNQMVIDIYHLDGKDSELVTYSPTESYGGSSTVSETIEIGINGENIFAGYSFDVGRTYPNIDMLCYTYNNVEDTTTDMQRTGVQYVLNWYSPSSAGIVSPYHGEIIRKIAVIFKVDFNSNPNYDSDSDTFMVDFTSSLYYGEETYPENIKFYCGSKITGQ